MVTVHEVTRSLAILIACEDRATADRYAAQLPLYLELVDAIRASDGAMQLAQSIDRVRRASAAATTVESDEVLAVEAGEVEPPGTFAVAPADVDDEVGVLQPPTAGGRVAAAGGFGDVETSGG